VLASKHEVLSSIPNIAKKKKKKKERETKVVYTNEQLHYINSYQKHDLGL
jgi:hypothetical protein